MNLGRDAIHRVSTQALKTVRATNKFIINAIYATINFVLRRIMVETRLFKRQQTPTATDLVALVANREGFPIANSFLG